MRDYLHTARHTIYKLISGHYNLLMTFLFFLFVFRPYQHEHFSIGVWKVFLTASLMMAIFTVHHHRKVKICVTILAIPAALFSWLGLFDQGETVLVANCAFNVAFMSICTASIVHDVVLRARVTMETLKGVICAYFLVAFIFAYIYLLIEAVQPGSILIRGESVNVYADAHFYFISMLYYSFVTLLTIGYGDVISVGNNAQTACVIEGIMGQFYIAILVSRLVSVYSFSSSKKILMSLAREVYQNKPPKKE
jgi:hypothetical protein